MVSGGIVSEIGAKYITMVGLCTILPDNHNVVIEILIIYFER